MNYVELCANIQEICETTFTPSQLAMFTKQAEQKIYNTVQLPVLRKNTTLTFTPGNPLLTLPSDFLYSYSFAVIDFSNNSHYLLNKDTDFMAEAYPMLFSGMPGTTGIPQYYAFQDAATALVAPAPDLAYLSTLTYAAYPLSISDPLSGGTTWLGDEFDSALLNGSLVEAIRFMKGEADLIALYEKLYVQAIGLLKVLGDGKLRQDTYRSGQVRIPVS
jgi:hypothetical protein